MERERERRKKRNIPRERERERSKAASRRASASVANPNHQALPHINTVQRIEINTISHAATTEKTLEHNF